MNPLQGGGASQHMPPEMQAVLTELQKLVLDSQANRGSNQGSSQESSPRCPILQPAPVHPNHGIQPPPSIGQSALGKTLGVGPVMDPILQNLAQTQKKTIKERGQMLNPQALNLMMGDMGEQVEALSHHHNHKAQWANVMPKFKWSRGDPKFPRPMWASQVFVNPLLQGYLSQKPTLLNKHQGGWRTFESQWKQHMEYVLACNQYRMPPDVLLLHSLKQSLDNVDQALLERRMYANSRLTYQEF